MKHAGAALAALLAMAAAGCSSSPSPADLERTLAAHPEILYRTIEKHPAEFMEVLNKAAMAAQAAQAQNAVQAEARRRDEEFRHPRIPVVSDRRAVRGSPNAPVTIVEYSDFQCPYCRREQEVLAQVLAKYPGKVRLVLKQLPLEMHPQALPASQMFEAIALQSSEKAWRFHDELFAGQEQLQARGEAFILEAAARAGADVPRARRDAVGKEVAGVISQDQQEAREFGFSGTPGILINGVMFDGAFPQADLEKVIDRHLAGAGAAR